MLDQYPGIGILNENRRFAFQRYNQIHMSSDQVSAYSREKMIGDWIQHKVYSIITLPANLLGTIVGLTGVVIGACTIGVFKVAVFAITLGNIRPPISTGVTWFSSKSVTSLSEVFTTSLELITDSISFVQYCTRKVREIAIKLGIYTIYLKIRDAVIRVFEHIGIRIVNGIKHVIQIEEAYQFPKYDLPFVTFINSIREKFVSMNYGEYNNRSFKDIFLHSAISVISIPANLIAASCSILALAASSIACFAKALFCIVTNLRISIPTFVGFSLEVCAICTKDLLANIETLMMDIPILLYKISKVTGIYQVAVKISQVFIYIPTAIFETFDSSKRKNEEWVTQPASGSQETLTE